MLSYVESVTEPGPPAGQKLAWMERKIAYLENIRYAGYGGTLISVADKLHNYGDLLRQFKRGGTWATLNPNVSAKEQLWFCRELLNRFRLNVHIYIKAAAGDIHRTQQAEALSALVDEYQKVVHELEILSEGM